MKKNTTTDQEVKGERKGVMGKCQGKGHMIKQKKKMRECVGI